MEAARKLGLSGYDATTVIGGVTSVSQAQLGPSTTLTYSSIGHWRTGTTAADFSQNFADVYFSYGIQTLAGDMPKSGSAGYLIELTGETPGANIGGSGTITANFGAGSVALDIAPSYVYGPGRVSQIGSMTGTGTISASSFAGDVAGAGHTGSVNGLFYGPQASEVGGTFTFSSPAVGGGQTSAAVFAGKRN